MMTYEFWMGIAISGLFHWFLLFLAAWRRDKQPASVKTTIELMRIRNDIGTRQTAWLRLIVEALDAQTEVATRCAKNQEEMINLMRPTSQAKDAALAERKESA